METTLDQLIRSHRDGLVDAIVKDAIRLIPAYAHLPIQTTVARVERWLDVLAESIARNHPPTLEDYLVEVAEERREEGFVVAELHTIVQITDGHLARIIEDTQPEEIPRNAQRALLTAVMDAARMVLSVTFVRQAARERGMTTQRGGRR